MRLAYLKPVAGLCLKQFFGVLLVGSGMGLVGSGNAWSQEEKSGAAPAAEVATTGSLAVSASFNGASILLDGEDTGKRTPAVLTDLAPGPHVVVARSRCLGARAKVTVVAGVETAVDMAMVQGKGRLKISTHPRQAVITVDGVAIGNAPLISNPLSCGEHVVEANSIGHESVSRIVDLPAFTKRRIHLTLQPLPPGAIAEALVGATATVETAAPDAAPEDASETTEASSEAEVAEAPAAATEDPEAPEAPSDAAETAEVTEATPAPADAAEPAETAEVTPAEVPAETPEESTGAGEAPSEEVAADAPADATEPTEAPSEEAPVAPAEGEAASSEVSEASDASVVPPTQVAITGAADTGGLSQTRLYGAGSLVLGAGFGVAGVVQHRKAKEAFFRFLDEPNDNIAILIYNDEVVPAKRVAYVMYGSGAVALAAGTFLWVRGDVALMPGPGGLVVSGRW
ncbi:MAG: PEGA domain-containing protein [Myxococcota bacterium]|nr:PEGA domain-containing protein [Myxococcota bacterium]